MRRWLMAMSALVVLFLSSVVPAAADGIIIPEPPPEPPIPWPTPPRWPPMPRPIPFPTLKYQRVSADISNQVAMVTVEQAFVNNSGRELEGRYIFPLPQDAAISDFAMWVDGQRLEGKLLDKEQARRLYEEVVRRERDPALLEYMGRGAYQARVYPIPAGGERRISLRYSQVLRQDGGVIRFTYPLTAARASGQPAGQLAISVRIRASQPIKAVYSPSHQVAVHRQSETEVQASYEEFSFRPQADFQLVYSLSGAAVGLSLLSHRPQGEDGFFLLLVAPPFEAREVGAKDVTLALDISGSMAGAKLQQAKAALRFILENLNPQDRFNIVAFSSAVTPYAEGLRPASERGEAMRFVEGLKAGGGTNINEALLTALRDGSAERPHIVVFLTDGLPTVGVTDAQAIIQNASQAAVSAKTRLFTFGVGYDVNTVLLDSLAESNRGASEYVRPQENLEEKLSAFYNKIASPVLTDLRLDFGGRRVSEVYPSPLPDLFAGGQLVVVGRYREGGPATVTLAGEVNGLPQRFTYNTTLAQEGPENEFIPRLWATRKIGYLLSQIRRHGSNKELIDEVVALSTKYGIITPYTSFLVEEPARGPEGRAQPTTAPAADLARRMAAAPAVGREAVAGSQALRSLQEAAQAQAARPEQVRYAGAKTFVRREGVWTDTAYRPGGATVKIGFGGDDYFRLLAARPSWGQYLALGERVIVCLEGKCYEVAPGEFATGGLPAPEPTPTLPPATPTPAPPTGPARPSGFWGLLAALWDWLRGLLGSKP